MNYEQFEYEAINRILSTENPLYEKLKKQVWHLQTISRYESNTGFVTRYHAPKDLAADFKNGQINGLAIQLDETDEVSLNLEVLDGLIVSLKGKFNGNFNYQDVINRYNEQKTKKTPPPSQLNSFKELDDFVEMITKKESEEEKIFPVDPIDLDIGLTDESVENNIEPFPTEEEIIVELPNPEPPHTVEVLSNKKMNFTESVEFTPSIEIDSQPLPELEEKIIEKPFIEKNNTNITTLGNLLNLNVIDETPKIIEAKEEASIPEAKITRKNLQVLESLETSNDVGNNDQVINEEKKSEKKILKVFLILLILTIFIGTVLYYLYDSGYQLPIFN